MPVEPTPNRSSGTFPVNDARRLVKDLNQPNPWIYWLDFLTSIAIGWAGFVITLSLAAGTLAQLAAYLVCSLALYRAVLFIHELAHRKRGTFERFRLVWNLLCGFPLMVPAFLYTRVHLDHHSLKRYGTGGDGEYLPFGAESPRHIVLFMALILVLPLLFPLRFLVISPLSLLHPRLRQLVWERFSSLTIDFNYLRPAVAPWEGDSAWWEELATFGYAAAIAAMLATGLLPMSVVWLWYLVVLMIFLLNSLRTLGAHAYRHRGDEPIGLDAQFLDSVDIPGGPWTGLWAPVGLRYHATHHLNPAMPYHALGTAYRRLAQQLAPEHGFLRATRHSLADAVRRLWRDAAASQTQT